MLLLFIWILSIILHLFVFAFVAPTDSSILMLFTLFFNILAIRNRLWPIDANSTLVGRIHFIIAELILTLMVIWFPCVKNINNLEHFIGLKIVHFLQLLDMLCYVRKPVDWHWYFWYEGVICLYGHLFVITYRTVSVRIMSYGSISLWYCPITLWLNFLLPDFLNQIS